MRRQMHRGMVAALLSAFVWPGAGQLYNRDVKKGAFLIGLTLAVAVAVIIATAAEGTRQLPADLGDLDADLVRTLPAQVLAARSAAAGPSATAGPRRRRSARRRRRRRARRPGAWPSSPTRSRPTSPGTARWRRRCPTCRPGPTPPPPPRTRSSWPRASARAG